MSKVKASITLLLSVTLVLATVGCMRTYRIDIQQGNVVSHEQLNKVVPGMKRNEVRFVLGTPLIEDPFHTDRWDYFYSYQAGSGEPAQMRRLSILFVDDQVHEIIQGDTSALPTASTAPTPNKPGFFLRLWHKITPGGD